MLDPIDFPRLELTTRLSALGTTERNFQTMLPVMTSTDAERVVYKMSELLGEISRLVGVIEWKEEKE